MLGSHEYATVFSLGHSWYDARSARGGSGPEWRSPRSGRYGRPVGPPRRRGTLERTRERSTRSICPHAETGDDFGGPKVTSAFISDEIMEARRSCLAVAFPFLFTRVENCTRRSSTGNRSPSLSDPARGTKRLGFRYIHTRESE